MKPNCEIIVSAHDLWDSLRLMCSTKDGGRVASEAVVISPCLEGIAVKTSAGSAEIIGSGKWTASVGVDGNRITSLSEKLSTQDSVKLMFTGSMLFLNATGLDAVPIREAVKLETVDSGWQQLLPGFQPITDNDRLRQRSEQPLRSRVGQKVPPKGGLFQKVVKDKAVVELNPILQIAAKILGDTPGREGHVDDIAKSACSKNINLGLDESTLSAKLSQALSVSIKKKDSPFTKPISKKSANGKISYKRGVYKLKQVSAKNPIEINTPPEVDKMYLGKAGELAVISELLFWGFNASLMLVDQGIDVVASKANRYFHLQVKTAKPRPDGSFNFTIKGSSFASNHNGSTYYVFVMRRDTGSTYVVVPSTHIDNLSKVGVIKGEDTLSIAICPDEKWRTFTMNKRDNVTHFVNNFGSIK